MGLALLSRKDGPEWRTGGIGAVVGDVERLVGAPDEIARQAAGEAYEGNDGEKLFSVASR
jgi:hypothetical protein